MLPSRGVVTRSQRGMGGGGGALVSPQRARVYSNWCVTENTSVMQIMVLESGILCEKIMFYPKNGIPFLKAVKKELHFVVNHNAVLWKDTSYLSIFCPFWSQYSKTLKLQSQLYSLNKTLALKS